MKNTMPMNDDKTAGLKHKKLKFAADYSTEKSKYLKVG